MKHPLFKNANAREDIARLQQKVANRESAPDDDARTVIDDVQLENTKSEELGCIYLTARTTDNGRDLLFIAERLIYNPSIDDNVPLGAESFRANAFSEWFATKRRDGWRVSS